MSAPEAAIRHIQRMADSYEGYSAWPSFPDRQSAADAIGHGHGHGLALMEDARRRSRVVPWQLPPYTHLGMVKPW